MSGTSDLIGTGPTWRETIRFPKATLLVPNISFEFVPIPRPHPSAMTYAHPWYSNCAQVFKNCNITNNIAPMPTQNPWAWVGMGMGTQCRALTPTNSYRSPTLLGLGLSLGLLYWRESKDVDWISTVSRAVHVLLGYSFSYACICTSTLCLIFTSLHQCWGRVEAP